MLKKVNDQISEDLQGLDTSFDIIGIGPKKTPNCMNVKFNLDGSIEKRLGSTSQNSIAVTGANTGLAYVFQVDSDASLGNNLKSYWKLDEGTGERDDFVGPNNLADINSVTSQGGIILQSALFSSANSQSLSKNSPVGLGGSGQNISVSSWFYLNSTGNRPIFSKGVIGNDPYNLVLWHCENGGAFKDYSNANHAVTTMQGSGGSLGVNQFARPMEIGNLFTYFSGRSSLTHGDSKGYLHIPNSTDWIWGGDFTVECLALYPNSDASGANKGIFQHFDSSNKMFNFSYGAGTGWCLILGTGSTFFTFNDTTSNAGFNQFVQASSFSHVALTRSSGVVRVFRDGSQRGLNTVIATSIQTGSRGWMLFNNTALATAFWGTNQNQSLFHGDIRFSNISRYNSEFVSQTSSFAVDTNTILQITFNGGVYGETSPYRDSIGGYFYMGSSIADFLDDSQKKFGNASLFFQAASGLKNYYLTPLNNYIIGTASDFTIELYVMASNASTFSSSSRYNYLTDGRFNTKSHYTVYRDSDNKLAFFNSQGMGAMSSAFKFGVFIPTSGTFHHIAICRSGTALRAFVDGTQSGTNALANSLAFTLSDIYFRAGTQSNFELKNCWMDEVRISKIARYTANFTPSAVAFGDFSALEYSAYVETDNILTFTVSSAGTTTDGLVRASSFGALSTGTWYNLVAWHTTGVHLGASINLSATTSLYTGGIQTQTTPFMLGAASNATTYFMDGRVDETGFWNKTLTAQNRKDLYNVGLGDQISTSPTAPNTWGMFDFGASGTRWLAVAAGTGLYASSNMGVTFVTIATDRSATYQSFERSKNIVIGTSDVYNTPIYWAGSVGTFAVMLNPSAPIAKYCVNFQGFNILLNTNARKRGFFYEDENTQLTGDWADAFDFPSSADDEITGSFILRKKLYITLRERIFRVTFVGGNPDWSYLEIKNFGYVPRTIENVFVEGVGEVILGMTWDRKLRLFDGSEDKLISTDVEDTNLCEFSMDNISQSGSGLQVSFSTYDDNEQVYKLWTAIGTDSSQVTHTLNFDGRIKALYPDDNQKFQCGIMANSANRKYLLAADRSGFVYILNNGNKDYGTIGIQDVYDSSFVFDKSPSQSMKSHTMDMYFSPASANKLYLQDRSDFSSVFKPRATIDITDTGGLVMIHKPIDIPNSHNVYQFRLTSSGETLNTAEPWRVTRVEHFTQGQGIGKNGPYQ